MLIVAQLIKKVLAPFGIPCFNGVFTRAENLTVSWANRYQFYFPYPIPSISFLILSSNRGVSLANYLSDFAFTIDILQIFLFSSMRSIYVPHLIILDLTSLIYSENCNSWTPLYVFCSNLLFLPVSFLQAFSSTSLTSDYVLTLIWKTKLHMEIGKT